MEHLNRRIFIKHVLTLMLLCIFSLALYGVPAQERVDKVVLRDGQEITGRLNFLDEASIQINGKSIERSKVKVIRFAGATNDLPEAVFDKDLVVRKDNSRSSGYVSRITNQLVIQNDARIKRTDVALIRLADNIHPIGSVPKESPTPSASVSPSSTPEESVAVEEPPSTDTDKSKNSSGQESASDPPWFDAGKKCNYRQRTYIFTGGYETSDHSKTLCFLYIHVCRFELNRKTELPHGSICPAAKDFAQPTVCCDEFNKAVKNKQGCDPMKDVDCDGTPNEQDSDPLNPKKH